MKYLNNYHISHRRSMTDPYRNYIKSSKEKHKQLSAIAYSRSKYELYILKQMLHVLLGLI